MGQSNFTQNCSFPQLSFPVIAAELKNFSFEQALQHYDLLPASLLGTAQRIGRRVPHVIQTSLIAALEAWQQAKLFTRSIENQRFGLVVAGHNTTQRYHYNLYTAFQQEPSYLSPTYALHFMDTDQVGTLSEVFNIHGEGYTVGAASASGNAGILHGYRLIQQDLVDYCMVVGVLPDLSPMELQGFYNIGALGGKSFQHDPSKACRPFDHKHEGFIWGQACGCLILESSSKAAQDKISPLGEIVGAALTLDGNRLSQPSQAGETRTMERALVDANMLPGDIQYINTHGSSSVLGDETEVNAIHAVFGKHTPDIWLNSTKSLIGHCLWAAGIVEAIAVLLQLQESFLHPNRNLDNPIDTGCRFVGDHSEAAVIQTAMSNSFGFGGINTSLIFTHNTRC